jgi:hypothetical protein
MIKNKYKNQKFNFRVSFQVRDEGWEQLKKNSEKVPWPSWLA